MTDDETHEERAPTATHEIRLPGSSPKRASGWATS